MKKFILIIFLFIGFFANGQSVGQFRYDTTKFLKVGGFNEVKIQNATKDTLGIFTNVGNGWGIWKRPRAVSGGILIGNDTIAVSGGSVDYVVPGFGVKVDSVDRTYTVSVDTSVIAKKDSIRLQQPLYVVGDTMKFNPDSSGLVKDIYKKTGTDSVFKTINGVDSFAFLLPSGGGGGGGVIRQEYTGSSSVLINDNTLWMILNPATLASAITVTLPASPSDNQKIEISFGGTITTGEVVTDLTIAPNTGQTILGGGAFGAVEITDRVTLQFNSSNSKWYR